MKTPALLAILLALSLAGCQKASSPAAPGGRASGTSSALPPASGKVKECNQEDDPRDKNCQVEVTLSQAGGGCTVEAIDPDEIRLKKNGTGRTRVGFALTGAVAGAAFADPPIRFFELDASGTKQGPLDEAAVRTLFSWDLDPAQPGRFDLKARHDGRTYGYSVFVVLKGGAKCNGDPRMVNGF